MTIKIHEEVEQGSDEWKALRCGVLTASEMKLIITPKLKIASNEKERQHLYELAAQRINNYVEPSYIGEDMLRGDEDEIYAREAYRENYAPVKEVGFITNDKWGFTLGYSPDGLVAEDGIIEIKSRRQKYQMETILKNEIPEEHIIQVQAGLLVSERSWCDYICYCGGMPMVTIRVNADPVIQDAIVTAATEFENRLKEQIKKYEEILLSDRRLIPTERRIEEEIVI